MIHHTPHIDTGLFAANALGAGWWVVDMIQRHGPSWEVLPPTLIGLASVLGAGKSFLNDRQARRHAEDRHRAEMDDLAAKRREALRLTGAGTEPPAPAAGA